MENGQETEAPKESQNEVMEVDATVKEVKEDKPADTEVETPKQEKQEEPTPELLQRIKEQVEYYFGNVNLQKDKYLTVQITLDDGWIPMAIMLNFKMLASMSTDVEVILKALESSELIEISEDRKKIRRSPKHPLPVFDEAYRKAQEARTVYIKGFPQQNVDMEKLKKFFAQYEPVENIIIRKYQDKEKKLQFKGSVFVQFKTLDDAKAFLARESVKYEDSELIRKWSADYTVEKEKEKEELRQKRAEKKAKKDEDVGKDNNEEEVSKVLPKGSVLHFANMPKGSTRENIKEALGAFKANIAFVEFTIGDEEAWVRLQEENAAQPIYDQLKDGKIIINKEEVQCRVIEGEEEEVYLAKVKEEIESVRQKASKMRRRGKKGQSTQKYGKKRRNDSVRDLPPPKKVAVE